MNKPIPYQNNRVETVEDNVDILFSIVGGGKPPLLPLREERQTGGVELVYNAKGTGQAAVFKEKRLREEMLLKKLNLLEQKLALKPSYKRTKKRQKALKLVRDLKHQLKNSTSGISYERYYEELKQMRRALKKADFNDDAGSQVSDTSNNTANIESKIMKTLQCLLDDSELDLDYVDCHFESESHVPGTANPNSAHNANEIYIDQDMGEEKSANNDEYNEPKVKVLLESTHVPRTSVSNSANGYKGYNTNEISIDRDTNQEKRANNEESNKSKVKVEPESTPLAITNPTLEKSIVRKDVSTISSKSSGVRLNDEKPSIDDSLAMAKSLLSNARVGHNGSNNESNNSAIQTDFVRQEYSDDLSISGDKGRYHLFVSHACSLSHRCLIIRALKRLQDVVSISYVHCKWGPIDNYAHEDNERDNSFWLISEQNTIFDPIFTSFQRNYMRQLEIGKVARVPILWDKKQEVVVSKNSTEIMKLLNFEFNQWSRRPRLDLFPAGLKEENEQINRWLHEKLCLGILRTGLATTQSQYSEAVEDVTCALDEAELIVRKRGFLAGKKLTESDVRLFVELFRFDEVYRVLFKANTRAISNMQGLMDFMRDIYQVKGMEEVCDLECIKREFYGAKGGTFIIPKGGIFINVLSNPSSI